MNEQTNDLVTEEIQNLQGSDLVTATKWRTEQMPNLGQTIC